MSRLAILTYHSVDSTGSILSIEPWRFAAQMASLAASGYRAVSLAAALDARDAQGRWPERTVAVTFDDGYRNLHQHAAPVLAGHGFTATVYLVTHHVGGRNDWESPPAGLGQQPILDWPQVRDLAAAGWEIGGHTRTHPDLRRLDPGRLDEELAGCREDLDHELGPAPRTLAYPYGFTSPEAIAAASRSYRAACTTVLGRAGGESLHALPRIEMYYMREVSRLDRLVEGRRDGWLRMRRWARWVRGMVGGR